METLKERLQLAVKPYGDRWLRFAISLVAAHYILSHVHHYGFWEVVFVKGYSLSLFFSFLIAVILVESIHWITRRLDLKMPYSRNWKVRTVLQIFLGIAFISLLAFLLACAYFLLFDEFQRWRAYLNEDFPIIVAFIIGVNAYYFIFYLIRVNLRLFRDNYELKKSNKASLLRHQKIDIGDLRKVNGEATAFIVKLGYKYKVVYMDGSSSNWYLSLKKTMQELDEHYFFMINSSCIINRQAIQNTNYISSKRYHINIIPSLQHIVPDDCFIVSQQRKQAFEKWV